MSGSWLWGRGFFSPRSRVTGLPCHRIAVSQDCRAPGSRWGVYFPDGYLPDGVISLADSLPCGSGLGAFIIAASFPHFSL